MCFSSLRYSDAISLKKSQIHPHYISVTTQKTSTNVKIELNKYTEAIINKYLNRDSLTLFPYYNNKDMNVYLKHIAKFAHIDEIITISQYYGNVRIERTEPKHNLISTHCGRRTFVCNALALGIPGHIVIKWTGHKEVTALKPYMDAADTIRRGEMNKFNSL